MAIQALALGPMTACVPPPADFPPRLFELRSYRAQPGKRDALIGMFEDVFLDAYQAGGARILGTFRSLDEPDRWVWMRAFPDAASRGARLRNFYGGDTWKQHAEACNATIDDVSEALLLRAMKAGALGSLCAAPRTAAPPACVYAVTVYPLGRAAEAEFARFLAQDAEPLLSRCAGDSVATFVSDHSENSYPRQAVRAGSVFVSLARFATRAAAVEWNGRLQPCVASFGDSAAAPETMLLAPSARSALR